MEEPTSNNDENKNPEEPTTAPLTTGAEPSTNETTSGEAKEEATPESSTDKPNFSVPESNDDSSSDAAPSGTSESSGPVTDSGSTPEPVVSSNEPPKIDVAAAEAESAATPSVPESSGSTTASTSDASGVTAPSSLAIDNPHPTSPGVKHGLPVLVVAVIAAILGLGGGFAVAAASGVSFKKQAAQTVEAPKVVAKELKVPDDATVISECAKGRGKQYVRPKDIPQGPVYNVFNGKVIGIEYMLSQKDMLANKDYLNLLLEGVAYDHMNVGLLSKGHSGYPEPHYHIDVFTVSNEEASKITCQ